MHHDCSKTVPVCQISTMAMMILCHLNRVQRFGSVFMSTREQPQHRSVCRVVSSSHMHVELGELNVSSMLDRLHNIHARKHPGQISTMSPSSALDSAHQCFHIHWCTQILSHADQTLPSRSPTSRASLSLRADVSCSQVTRILSKPDQPLCFSSAQLMHLP